MSENMQVRIGSDGSAQPLGMIELPNNPGIEKREGATSEFILKGNQPRDRTYILLELGKSHRLGIAGRIDLRVKVPPQSTLFLVFCRTWRQFKCRTRCLFEFASENGLLTWFR